MDLLSSSLSIKGFLSSFGELPGGLSIGGMVAVLSLVVVRLLPIAILVPSAFAQSSTRKWTVLIVIGFAIAIWPTCIADRDLMASIPNQIGDARSGPIILLRETLLGIALGLGFSILLGALQITGYLLGQMTGMRWITGGQDAAMQSTGMQRYFGLLTLAVFVSSKGYQHFVSAVLESFTRFPPATSWSIPDASGTLADILWASFALGIRTAAPVVFCVLISTLMFSILARSSSALGGMGVNLAANVLVMLVVCWASVGLVAEAFQDYWTTSLIEFMVRVREGVG